MSDWELVDNPAVPLKHGPLVACHDGSAFLTFRHGCGDYLHIHVTQLPDRFHRDDELHVRCPACAEVLALPAGLVLDAFAAVNLAMEATTDRRDVLG